MRPFPPPLLLLHCGSGIADSNGAVCACSTAKYNQLLRIEEELGAAAVYTGEAYRLPPLK